jgi:DNA mismatch repair ATPase MutS
MKQMRSKTIVLKRSAGTNSPSCASSCIVAEMTAIVRDDRAAIEEYRAAVTAIDVALAAAELANALGMTRPIFGDGGSGLEVHEARLVPLEEECGRRDVAYQSLNIALDTRHLLLRGSNMTGKTVVLKTIASMQLLAQLGLFVPAERLKTIVFDRICFIGGVADEPARGLSSFGREMIALRDAISARDGAKTLLLIDEFARTTGSVEAVALIAGLLDFLNRSTQIHSLFATHYASLPPFPRIRAYRTKGIDWQRLSNLPPDGELAKRVEAINRCVSYELIPDSNGVPVVDAIRIAEQLGIDASIIRFARQRVEGAML